MFLILRNMQEYSYLNKITMDMCWSQFQIVANVVYIASCYFCALIQTGHIWMRC